MMILVSSTEALASEPSCAILIAPSTTELAILSDTGHEVARIGGIGSWLAPDQKTLAVEVPDSSGLGNSVAIYDVSEQMPVKRQMIPDQVFIRGVAWSPDSQKLLLQDAQNNFLLSLYDLNSDQIDPLYKTFDPGLQVYQAAWNAAGNRIALVAKEAPLQRTGYGNVVALYVVDPITHTYHPVSSPDENVDYYYANFYWKGNDQLVFTACATAGDPCKIRVTNLEGELQASLDGDDLLVGYDGKNSFLAVGRSSSTHGGGEVNLVKVDLSRNITTTLFQFPVDPVTPMPIFSLSPDHSYLSYLTSKPELFIANLKNKSSEPIDLGSAYDSGSWSPNGQQLLFQSGDNLYVYDLQMQKSQLVYTAQNNYGLYERWLCVSNNS